MYLINITAIHGKWSVPVLPFIKLRGPQGASHYIQVLKLPSNREKQI